MNIFAAPLQGYTEEIYRHTHADIYPDGPDCWFTPFIRMEHGAPRARDMRRLASPLNSNHNLVPQIIFRDEAEWGTLVDAIVSSTPFRHIDMNLGCPFVPQVRKGRGAGFIPHHDRLRAIADKIAAMPGLTFSIKMRPGIERSDEWEVIAPIINDMPLSHVTIHPRVAVMQYDGMPDLSVISRAFDIISHPIIYNGDITTPAMIDEVTSRFPCLAGIMIGRGLLARPSLVTEWRIGREWNPAERMDAILQMHDAVATHCENTLSGESQILAKLKPFWDYLLPSLDKRTAKAIKKSTTLAAYHRALASIS